MLASPGLVQKDCIVVIHLGQSISIIGILKAWRNNTMYLYHISELPIGKNGEEGVEYNSTFFAVQQEVKKNKAYIGSTIKGTLK